MVVLRALLLSLNRPVGLLVIWQKMQKKEASCESNIHLTVSWEGV